MNGIFLHSICLLKRVRSMCLMAGNEQEKGWGEGLELAWVLFLRRYLDLLGSFWVADFSVLRVLSVGLTGTTSAFLTWVSRYSGKKNNQMLPTRGQTGNCGKADENANIWLPYVLFILRALYNILIVAVPYRPSVRLMTSLNFTPQKNINTQFGKMQWNQRVHRLQS